MNAMVCEAPGRLALARRPMPVRADDEVLVRIRRVGICGTDMHIVRGTQPYLSYPRVMGHELSGEVAEAPPGSSLKSGDPVFIMPYLSCGACNTCKRGRTNCCENLRVLGVHCDGGLAEYLCVPERFVHAVHGVSLDDAAMIEFLAIGAHAVRRAQLAPELRVLVVGAGPIGLAAALFARLDGANVAITDRRPDRLAFASAHLGVTDLAAVAEGDAYDVVFDATGSAKAIEAGFAHVASAGTYVLISVVPDRISFSDPDFHRREMTLMGSRNATREDFERVLAAMRAGQVPTRALNSHRTRLADLSTVMPQWMTPEAGVIKGIVEC